MASKGTGTRRPQRKHAPFTKDRAAGGEPLVQRTELHAVLLDLANRIAPADVATLMGREPQLRERAARLAPPIELLRAQLDLAFDCLRDHVAGACPQIPYSTISLLAAAVSYFADEIDLVPDFLPRIGRLDDAAIMALAFQLGREGLQRYCTATGRPADAVLAVPKRPRPGH